VLDAIPPQYLEPDPVRVHRDVAEWLRAGCSGIVLLTRDRNKAQRVLRQIHRVDTADDKPVAPPPSCAKPAWHGARLEGLVRKIITADQLQREGTLRWACRVLGAAAGNGEIRPDVAAAALVWAGTRAGSARAQRSSWSRPRSGNRGEPMRGSDERRGYSNGHADSSGPVLDVAHLKGEIARLRELKAEGVEEVEWEFDLAQTGKRIGFGKRKFRQYVEPSPDGDDDRAVPISLDQTKNLVDAVKPELIVETANLPAAADAVRDLLAAAATSSSGVFRPRSSARATARCRKSCP
jgi:hypothetical protein